MPLPLLLPGRHLGGIDHATAPPRSARRHSDHVGRVRAYPADRTAIVSGLSQQAKAYVIVQPLCVASRRAPWAVALGRIRPDTVRIFKISFFDLFNLRNGSKLLEFV
jgi:hypothetical protein